MGFISNFEIQSVYMETANEDNFTALNLSCFMKLPEPAGKCCYRLFFIISQRRHSQ